MASDYWLNVSQTEGYMPISYEMSSVPHALGFSKTC